MMLGIVLHSVITYIGGEPYDAWPIRDLNNYNTNLEWVNGIIHVFRMPIFMVVAGFFAALLFYERGRRQMFKNRMQRITLPFIVFVVLLFIPVTGGMSYTLKVFASNPDALLETMAEFGSFWSYIPNRTMHLWFLYYLIMFSVASFALGLLFKSWPKLSSKINKVYRAVFEKPLLRLVVFSLMTVVVLIIMNRYWVNTSTSFVPDWGTFIFYFYFYMMGWLLYKSKDLLSSFKTYDWQYTFLGTALFTWYFFTDTSELSIYIIMIIRSLSCWLLILGITGLFIRFGSNHSPRMRYISDSSYWVYLLHLPLTIIIPALIADWNLPGSIKFLLVTLLTTIICFLTYHYFVRSTFIGKFLNGRRYSRKIRDITPESKPKIQLVADK